MRVADFVTVLAQTTQSGWTETARGVQSIVQAGALIIGGGWAYAKFVRGRTFYPRCSMKLDVAYRPVGFSPAFRIDIEVRNSGQGAVVLASDLVQRLIVTGIDETIWQDAITHKTDPIWSEGEQPVVVDILLEEGFPVGDWSLEPNEALTRSVLVPVEKSHCAFRADLQIQGRRFSRFGLKSRPFTWQVDRVFTTDDGKEKQ
jgi:hypothetical protein